MKYMKALALVAILAVVAGCSLVDRLDSPEKKYYAANTAVVAVLRLTDNYVTECKLQVKSDPCYGHFPAINRGAKEINTSLTAADKVFVSGESDYFDLALIAVDNAVDRLRKILMEAS